MTYESDGRERLVSGHTGRMFLFLTFILVALAVTQRLLPPLLPAIIDDLGLTAFTAGVALTMLRLARSTMQYPSGRFADQFGRTPILLLSVTLATLGVAILSVSWAFLVFLAGVTIFGLGRGLYTPAARALLSDLFQEKRGRAFGLNMIGSDISGIIASGLAVWIVAIATWRSAFFPLALVMLPLPFVLYWLSRETYEVERPELGIRDTGGRIFGKRTTRWLLVVYSFYVFSLSGLTSFLPVFLTEVHDFSFVLASFSFAIIFAVGIFARPISGYISDFLSRPLIAGVCFFAAAGGIGALSFGSIQPTIIGGVVLFAIGQKGAPPALQAYMMDRFPDESMGGDLGAMRGIYMTIGSLGPGYTGFVASQFGYLPAFSSLIAFLSLGGLILLWFTVRQ